MSVGLVTDGSYSSALGTLTRLCHIGVRANVLSPRFSFSLSIWAKGCARSVRGTACTATSLAKQQRPLATRRLARCGAPRVRGGWQFFSVFGLKDRAAAARAQPSMRPAGGGATEAPAHASARRRAAEVGDLTGRIVRGKVDVGR